MAFKDPVEYQEEMKKHRERHKQWREWTKKNRVGFFPIFSEFLPYLKNLSPNAIRLYVYLGHFIDNETGECTVSMTTMSQFFSCDKRTVQNWFKELIDAKLVARIQPGFRKNTYTFLLPYSSVFGG